MPEIDLFEEPTPTPTTAAPDLFGTATTGVEPVTQADVLDTTDIFGGEAAISPPTPAAAEPPPPVTDTGFVPRIVQREETVKGQFEDLFAQDDPISQMAQQRQLRVENRRGLLNTAAGQQRGELSAIQAELEIAGRDAATYARAAELNQSYEEAANLSEQSFEHNWNLNNQLQQNASTLSYQDFTQGIQASIQTFKEQSALLLQQLSSNLDLSDKDQQELLELTTVQHENTIREIEAQGEIAKASALEQIAARGSIEMDQLIKSSDLTIDQLIAKGDIDIGNVLTQIEAQHGYVIAQMIKSGEITIDQMVQQGEIDLELIKAQVRATHENKILEMTLGSQLNIQEIAAQGGVSQENLLAGISAQLTADQFRAVQNNEITLGQLVARGDIDMGLLTERMTTEQANALERMLVGQDLTLDQMAEQAGIDMDRLLSGIEAQLTADQVRMLVGNEITLGQLVAQGDIDMGLLASRLSTEHANRLTEMFTAGDLTIEQMQEQGDINRDNMIDQIQQQLSADKSMAATAQEFNLSLSQFQNNLSILRDAQQSYLRREEMGIQLQNDLVVLGEQTAAAITLSDLDHLESLNFLTRGTTEDIKRMTVANGFTQEQQDNALENVKQEILAREDSAVVLSNLDNNEARELSRLQGSIESYLTDQRSDLTIIENNSQFANRLIEIQAQTANQAQLNADTGARQLQTNYLIESGSMLRQAMQDIAQINTTEGLTANQQSQAINQVRTTLQSNLDFMQELYSTSPGWDPEWEYTPPDDLFTPPPNTPGFNPPGPGFDPGSRFDPDLFAPGGGGGTTSRSEIKTALNAGMQDRNTIKALLSDEDLLRQLTDSELQQVMDAAVRFGRNDRTALLQKIIGERDY